ncbi:MAG: hypothetical protein LBV48_01135 [Mycoplasmataceae bacterium]|nr:hypothetical protein [Mycoplasmataceae bacterium]
MNKNKIREKFFELESYIKKFNTIKHEFSKKTIVSLTTFGPRIPTVHYTIMSILAQTKIPYKIFLYIYKEKISDELINLQKQFSKIFFIKKLKVDMKSYSKLLPALDDEDAKNKNIVTIDDDIIYNKNLINALEEYNALYPDCIIGNGCHSVKEISCKYYKTFLNKNDRGSKSNDIFLMGVGGVLYPPNCFKKRKMNYAEAKALCPSQDDIYFWLYEKINNLKRIPLKNELLNLDFSSIIKHNKKLFTTNRKGGNDAALENIFSAYTIYKS